MKPSPHSTDAWLSPWLHYEFQPAFLLGFHGCDASVGEAILRGEETHLRPSENDYDWLGSGIYFWEGNPQRALEFAQERQQGKPNSRGKIQEPFILGALINPRRCLDLADATAISQIKDAHFDIVQAFQSRDDSLPSNGASLRARKLDCLVFNTLHALREARGFASYDTVRGLFWEGQPLYEGAGISEGNHIQICVRNPECILGYFRPIRLAAS